MIHSESTILFFSTMLKVVWLLPGRLPQMVCALTAVLGRRSQGSVGAECHQRWREERRGYWAETLAARALRDWVELHAVWFIRDTLYEITTVFYVKFYYKQIYETLSKIMSSLNFTVSLINHTVCTRSVVHVFFLHEYIHNVTLIPNKRVPFHESSLSDRTRIRSFLEVEKVLFLKLRSQLLSCLFCCCLSLDLTFNFVKAKSGLLQKSVRKMSRI